MFQGVRNAGSLVVLVLIAVACVKVGGSLKTGLTVFSLIVWVICAILGIYMVFLRDMKFTLYKPSREDEDEPTVTAMVVTPVVMDSDLPVEQVAAAEHVGTVEVEAPSGRVGGNDA